MKILYISKYASHPPFGIETRHFYLSRELIKRGHEVQLIASNSNHHLNAVPRKGSAVHDKVPTYWVNTVQYKKPYGLRRIASWIDFERKVRRKLEEFPDFDVIWVSSLSLLSILNGIYYKRKYGSKLVFEIRDIWPLVLRRISNISKFNPIYLLLRRIEQKGYKKSDLVIGTMPNLKAHVAISQPDKDVMWVPHCVNPAVKMSDDTTQVNGLDLFNKSICYAGSVNRSSGLETFLKTAELYKKSDDLAFVVMGDGPMKEEFQNQFSNPNVFFVDKVPQNQVVSMLSQFDFLYDGYLKSNVYVFGSSRNKYVEYCSAGKPMLIAYEGYPLFVETHKCGFVVEPESIDELQAGIEKLLSTDDKELKEMGNNARKFASDKLNIDHQVDKIIAALNVS